eukprot:3749507-Amphidinium_carterae.1
MKMTLLIQHIQGDIKSYLLLHVNLATADFEDAATKVEDYYRNVYIDNNNGGGIQALGKPKGGKYGGKPYYQKRKGKGKGNYNYDYQPKGGYYNYKKSKGKGKGDTPKGPPLPSNQYYNKGKGGKRSEIVCYYCGKPGHTSDKC